MECLDGMAQVACDCGRYDEAIDLWSQAVAVSEKPNSELFANLGECRLCSARTGLLRDAGVKKAVAVHKWQILSCHRPCAHSARKQGTLHIPDA